MASQTQSVDDFLGPETSGTTQTQGTQDPDDFLGTGGLVQGQATGSAGPIPPAKGLDKIMPVVSPIARGITKTLGLPGDLEALAKSKTGINFHQILPTSNYLTNELAPDITQNIHGMTPNDPGWGRAFSKAAEGVGGAVPLLPFLPEDAAVNALVAGGAGGLGGVAATTVLPNAKSAELAGNLLGGGVAGAAENAVTKVGNAMRGEITTGAQDFANLGIPARSIGLVSDNPATRKTYGPLAPLEQTTEDLKGAVERIADKSGSADTLQKAGTMAQNEAQRWLQPLPTTAAERTAAIARGDTLAAKIETLYQPVDQYIPGTTPTKLNNFESALTSMGKKGGDLSEVVDELLPSLPKRLQDQLGKTQQAVSGGAYTWNDVKTLRSVLGDELSNPRLPKDISNDQVKQLYAAISDDMRGAATDIDTAAAAAGQTGHALESFNTANDGAKSLFNYKDSVLAKIVQSEKPGQAGLKPEDIANSLLGGGKKGATDLQQLRINNPAIADELASYQLRTMGFDKNTGTISPQFAKQWKSLPPETKEALWPDPATRAQIDSATRIADRVTIASKAVKPDSGSHGMGWSAAAGAGAAAIGDTALNLLGGSFNIPSHISLEMGALAGAVGPRILNAIKSGVANNKLLAKIGAGKAAPFGARGGAALAAPYATGNYLTDNPSSSPNE